MECTCADLLPKGKEPELCPTHGWVVPPGARELPSATGWDYGWPVYDR